MRRPAMLVTGALLAGALQGGCQPVDDKEPLAVFAAASLQDVLRDLPQQAIADTERPTVFNFAGSNTLAHQLVAAPRGQVFVSADRASVELLEARGLTVRGSRRALFGNQLVLIAHRGTAPALRIDGPADLAQIDARLALADPAAVPAGRYARSALAALPEGAGTLWDHLEPRIIPTSDVRSALALVESTPGLLGIVYRTDAATSTGVEVLCTVPTPREVPIVYWGVATVSDSPSGSLEALAYLDSLATPAARAVFGRHGFVTLDG